MQAGVDPLRAIAEALLAPASTKEEVKAAAAGAAEAQAEEAGGWRGVFGALGVRQQARKWSSSLVGVDPRHQILDFFRRGDERGPAGMLEVFGREDPKMARPSGKVVSEYFSVWRPTSLDAIRAMMLGKVHVCAVVRYSTNCKRELPSESIIMMFGGTEDRRRRSSTGAGGFT